MNLPALLAGSLAVPLSALAAVVLDRLLGEPVRWHPLVGFGQLAAAIERRLNRRTPTSGVAAWCLAVFPWVGLALLVRPQAAFLCDTLLLYFVLGARSLGEHAEAVASRLQAGDLDGARLSVGRMVSRETSQLDAVGVTRAALESVLENGNDAILAALFWFALLGGPGALLFRLANTLDAMWGYRTSRYLSYGRAAARIDDCLGWLPARLTALSYALLGRTRPALFCWRTQAPAWDSPNAGPVMAAGAGSLGVLLGGPAIYHGREDKRPSLGSGLPPLAGDLRRAVGLVRRSVWLWLVALFAIAATRGLHA